MAGGSTNAVILKHIRTLYHTGAIGGLTDGQLLERFVDGRDATAEVAFAALMERHGPMVFDVCRQMLGNPHEAQDAFQATFFVLVRKARSVRKSDSVASWLHGVARRVAMRAKTDAARRRMHEREGAKSAAAETLGDGDRPECWPELHEEISGLPERYREPVVLCYLEGLTTDAAAQRLGCPKGTVLSRLSRARERLRVRLTRRDLALPAGLPAAGMAPQAVATGPAADLIDATLHSSLQFAGQSAPAAALAPATAVALARGVLHAMAISKLKILGTAALASLLALGGIRTFALPFGSGGEAGGPAVARPEADDEPTAPARTGDDLRAKLDEAAGLNIQLRKELQDLRAELQRLRARSRSGAFPEIPPVESRTIPPSPAEALPEPRPVVSQPVSLPPPVPLPAVPLLAVPPPTPVGAYEVPRYEVPRYEVPRYEVPRYEVPREEPRLANDAEVQVPREPRPTSQPNVDATRPYFRLGGLIFAASPTGNKVIAHDPVARQAKSLVLHATKENPLKVSFEDSSGILVALHLQGSNITRIAVFDIRTGTWYPQDLSEPYSGVATPAVQPKFEDMTVGYDLGRFAYTFSTKTGKWDALDIGAISDTAEGEEAGKAKPRN